MNISYLLKSCLKKDSILRIYENELVKTLKPAGVGIDLGAKSTSASYYRYLDQSMVKKIDFVDFYSREEGVININLEEPFPITTEKYDFVILFNVMEHIFDYRNLLNETHRILKPDGEIHGLVPFMWRFHPDPNDYFRFTSQSLQRLLSESGYATQTVTPICFGPFKASSIPVGFVMRFGILRFFLYSTAIALDKLYCRFSRGGENFAAGFYFYAKKQRVA